MSGNGGARAVGAVERVATMGESLPQGGSIGRIALSAVASAGPSGMVSFPSVAQNEAEGNAIWCRCPGPAGADNREVRR